MKEPRNATAAALLLLTATLLTLISWRPGLADPLPLNELELDTTTALGANVEIPEDSGQYSVSDDIQRRRSTADPVSGVQRDMRTLPSGAFKLNPLPNSTNIIQQIR